MNNIAEGFERKNNNELIRFLYYSKGSAGEVRSLLYVALDLKYITDNEFEKNYELSVDIIKQISNFIKYLNSNNQKQHDWKTSIFKFCGVLFFIKFFNLDNHLNL